MIELNDSLREAMSTAKADLSLRPERLDELREEDLRTSLHGSLVDQLGARAEREKGLILPSFRGVGPFDLLVRDDDCQEYVALGEVKWSYTKRSKIFESVWDAVKLCLAKDELGISTLWLIVGAPVEQWKTAEGRELLTGGEWSFSELWNSPLDPPGSNYGRSIGEDLLLGGRGNRFTRTTEAFSVEEVSEFELNHRGDEWSVRAVALTPGETWIEEFAEAPEFPKQIRQSWLDENVPAMDKETYEALLVWLRQKRWNDQELETRVHPLRGNA